MLRGFDRRTGAPLAEVDFAPYSAVQLNDVAVAPDGALRITDTGIIMGKDGVVYTGQDRIFMLGPGRSISAAASGPSLRRPNGIAWDSLRGRWIVLSFDPFVGEVAAMPADMSRRQVLRAGAGQLDGVELQPPRGTVVYTSWADSSVHAVANGVDRQIIREVPVAADIGLDTKRRRLAVPLSMLGRVQLWDVSAVEPAPTARRD